jgi:predicted MFS family arabinose efflux permease
VPFSIFRKHTLTGANVVGLMLGGSLFAMFFFITLHMQQVLGYSPIKAGLSYLPLSLAIILSAGLASQLVTRIGCKPVLVAGLVLVAAGLVWFSGVSVDGGFASDILGPSLLAAVGLGFAFVTTTIAAVSGIVDHEQGLASGLINTSQQIGGALGLAILATVANSRTDDVLAAAGGSPRALPEALVEGFQSAFLGAALIAVIGLVLTLVLISSSDSRAHVALTEKKRGAAVDA